MDTLLDPNNCGDCGVQCATGEVCSAGNCGFDCVGDTTDCNGVCVDTDVDPGNCGGCANTPNTGDNICDAEELCSAGNCGFDCVGGTTDCNGVCVDTDVDPGNCGGCANTPNAGDNICATEELCSAGTCDATCFGGTTECNGLCVDIDVDPGNCGGCANTPNAGDNICAAEEVCSAGTCDATCFGGTTECNGACVDTDVDPGNCGGCANTPNAGDNICAAEEVCSAGTCEFNCFGGTTDCNGICVDTDIDPNNCGGCAPPAGTTPPCPAGQNSTPVCAAGTCAIVCDAGFYDCDLDATTGCEKSGTHVPEICNGIDDDCDGIIDDGCPSGITVTSDGWGPLHGNVTGGSAFADTCPAGEVLIQLSGRYGGNIDRVRGRCGTLNVVENTSADPFTYSVTVTPGTYLPTHGSNYTTAYTITCPANTVAYGLGGRTSSGGVQQLTLYCANINVAGAPGSFTLSYGTSSTVTVNGSSPGTAFMDYVTIPDVVNRLQGRAGAWIDAIGMGWAEMTLIYQ